MRSVNRLILLGLSSWILTGCVFDSSRLLSCETDAECPSHLSCDPKIGYCTPGEPSFDEDAIVLDTAAPPDMGPDIVEPTCGADPLPCSSGFGCCGAGASDCADGGDDCVCTPILNDVANCGGCGIACTMGQTCVQGVCSCPGGLLDCGAGCADILEDSANCGACGFGCPLNEACVGGGCLCGANLCDDADTCCPSADGSGTICVDTQFSPEHCGACGQTCGDGEVCSNGVCECGPTLGVSGSAACSAAGALCCMGECVDPTSPLCFCGGPDMLCASDQLCCNDACADKLSDVDNCGSCGQACNVAAGELCIAGVCGCGGSLPNDCSGSCVNLSDDAANCGACGMACGAGEVCCSGICIDTANDPLHCSACASACTGDDDSCCDSVCADTDTEAANCGACGNSCSGATGDCCSGACVDLDADTNNCGACGTACGSLPGAETTSCESGVCEATSCLAGFTDCDGDPTNGCEASDGSDANCPSTSCKAILDDGHSVGTGVYWIDFDGGGAFEVFCDMDADGGGWTLFGRLDQPSQWDVPSNDQLVHPVTGTQHYNYRLGTMPMTNFRIRMGSSADPSQNIRGDWYYEWDSPLQPKDIYEDVCSRTSIAPDRVISIHWGTTHNGFACARTDDLGANGPAYDPTCWTQACPSGPGASAMNWDGSFSWATGNGAYSGQDQDGTVFFGCDDGNCCMCWGPDGSGNHCYNNCDTWNGGQATSTGHAWIAIR